MSLAMIHKVFSMTAKTTALQRLLLLALADCHNEQNGKCYPSTGTLARMVGTDRRSVTRTITALLKSGLLVRHKMMKRNGMGWSYTLDLTTEGNKTRVPLPRVPMSPQEGASGHSYTGQGVPLTGIQREYNGNIDAGGIPAVPIHHRFVKPTEDEVRTYCAEQGYADVDPAQFVDYYEAKGWTVGRSPMRDWKSAVRNWHRRNQSGGSSAPAGSVIHNASRKESDYVL